MSKRKEDYLQGSLDMLVLQTLSLAPKHGYGIATHIKRASNEVLRVEAGSLYPALYRMEHAGLIKSEWGTTTKNRRAKFYKLTKKGERHLAKEEKKWNGVVDAIRTVMRYA